MLGLIFKDLLLIKWYIGLSLGFGIMMIIPTRGHGVSLAGIYLAWLSVWFILARGLFALDDHMRSEAIVNSLPVTRKEIVCGRHLTSLVFIVYGLFVMLAWVVILKFVGFRFPATIPWASVILGGLIASAFLTAVLFPMFFRLDFMKARWLSLFVFIFIYSSLGGLQRPDADGTQIPRWIESMLGRPDVLNLGMAVLIFAALMWLSIQISERFYRSREF